MEKIRFGIIGLGNQGSTYALQIFEKGEIENGTLSAMCDINPAKIEYVKGKTQNKEAKYFTDYKEMLDSGLCDAVLIETPHYLHPEMAKECFARNIHVLCEKPAGVYAKQVREMNEAAERSQAKFSVMFNQRTNCVYRKMREIVHSGGIGELQRVTWIITDWYRPQAYYNSGSWRATWSGEGGGVLLNQCPHNLDLWQWICGMPVKVQAHMQFGKWHDIEVEDDVTAYVEYASGATGTFITTTGEAPGTNRLEISGDRGKLVIENGELTVWRLSAPEREICFTAREGYPRLDTAVESWRPQAKETAHNGILQNFTNAILYGEELLAPGVEGLNSLMISNAAYLSSWTGQTVDLPLDGALYYRLLQEKVHHSSVKNRPRAESVPQGRYNARWSVKW